VAGDETSPGWPYSIGLWHTFHGREIAIFGIPTDTAMRRVNVACQLVKEGATLTAGDRRPDILAAHDVTLRQIDPRWYPSLFGSAIAFYQRPSLPILQLCWPDQNGRFSCEPSADDACRNDQPMLWIPPTAHPDSKWAWFDPHED
jgi:hypothetical protein